MGFGVFNKLSIADVDFLKAQIPSYTSNDNDQIRAGVNLSYNWNDITIIGQYIDAEDGALDRDAWFIQPSFKFELPYEWKYLNIHELVFRYGEYNVSGTKSISNPSSWDRQDTTFALISDIRDTVKIKTEYTIHDEDTGAGGIKNDEILMQLEVKF